MRRSEEKYGKKKWGSGCIYIVGGRVTQYVHNTTIKVKSNPCNRLWRPIEL
jgi:hypothetical protein